MNSLRSMLTDRSVHQTAKSPHPWPLPHSSIHPDRPTAIYLCVNKPKEERRSKEHEEEREGIKVGHQRYERRSLSQVLIGGGKEKEHGGQRQEAKSQWTEVMGAETEKRQTVIWKEWGGEINRWTDWHRVDSQMSGHIGEEKECRGGQKRHPIEDINNLCEIKPFCVKTESKPGRKRGKG